MKAAPTRPFSVTLTFWGVLLLGGWNGGRVLAMSLNYRTLARLNAAPDLRIRLGMALVWAILLGGAAIGLWQRRPFTRKGLPLLLSLYAMYELGLLALFAQSPSACNSWLVNTLFYLSIMLFSIWALNRTAVKTYFMD